MFFDEVKIFIKGGNGGNGTVAFRREKYVPFGGPSGGDGGRGGNVIICADNHLNTLLDYKYKRHHKANRGEHGGGSNKRGKDASDLMLKVPAGTIVKDANTGEIIADLVYEGDEIIAAKGGRGGRGNARFSSPTHQAPKFAENGEPGEEKWIILELKLIADAGLIGLPNVGKSTLLSVLTQAKPKIADYPFTTLAPNLGVVGVDDGKSFVLADIPGLIYGAHEGAGLGHQFLRHIERTKVLIHVLDGSELESEDPIKDFEIINCELEQYSKKLLNKPQVVAVNKIDLPATKQNYSRIEQALTEKGYTVFPISAIAKIGLTELKRYTYKMIEEIKLSKPEESYQDEEVEIVKEIPKKENGFYIKKEGDVFILEGQRLERLAAMTNFNNEDSVRRFQRIIDRMGVEKKLRELGIREGNIVKIGNIEFEYYENSF